VRSAGITAYACEPLIAGDRLLGTLSFASRSRRSFDGDDLIFFRDIAKQVAIARSRRRAAK
jgi:GAF domain-containing protein